MSLGTLALIGICGLCGPLLSAGARGAIPAVVGEILAGLVIGHTGFNVVDTSNATLTFLADIGFAMLMFNAGMHVPLHDERVRASLGRGALGAGAVAVLAVGGGLLVSRIGATGHPAVYAVLIASGSAAVVLPVIQERRLRGEAVLTVIAQVAVADIAATIAIPFVLAAGACRSRGGRNAPDRRLRDCDLRARAVSPRESGGSGAAAAEQAPPLGARPSDRIDRPVRAVVDCRADGGEPADRRLRRRSDGRRARRPEAALAPRCSASPAASSCRFSSSCSGRASTCAALHRIRP